MASRARRDSLRESHKLPSAGASQARTWHMAPRAFPRGVDATSSHASRVGACPWLPPSFFHLFCQSPFSGLLSAVGAISVPVRIFLCLCTSSKIHLLNTLAASARISYRRQLSTYLVRSSRNSLLGSPHPRTTTRAGSAAARGAALPPPPACRRARRAGGSGAG